MCALLSKVTDRGQIDKLGSSLQLDVFQEVIILGYTKLGEYPHGWIGMGDVRWGCWDSRSIVTFLKCDWLPHQLLVQDDICLGEWWLVKT